MNMMVFMMCLLFVPSPANGESVEATRGITGSVVLNADGPRIRPRSDLDLDSPLLVRVVDAQEGDEETSYQLEFIGVTEGVFDLRDVLENPDGSRPDHLPPIMVEIISNLEENAATDVFVSQNPGATLSGGYRVFLVVLGIGWLGVPLLVVARRLLARPVIDESPVVPDITLADQLRPLVTVASERGLSVAERGRLELLLYGHWQEQSDLQGLPRSTAVARLRNDEHAGPLLRAIEGWLHRPGTTENFGATPEDIDRLLEPYRRVAPISMEGGS